MFFATEALELVVKCQFCIWIGNSIMYAVSHYAFKHICPHRHEKAWSKGKSHGFPSGSGHAQPDILNKNISLCVWVGPREFVRKFPGFAKTWGNTLGELNFPQCIPPAYSPKPRKKTIGCSSLEICSVGLGLAPCGKTLPSAVPRWQS